ncbi:FtsQ-type POTRA domain-containing protein [Agromyces bauzanensis]
MKRPQGFDRPTPRASRAGAEAPDAPEAAVRRTPRPSAPRAPSPSIVAPADRVATEPIPVVAASVEAERDGPPRDGPPRDALPRDARAAKRALAAAARERRRYERQEVRRFTRRSRRRRIAWAVALGSIAALVAVVAIGAYSPLMALREVRIEGAQRVPAAELQAAFADVMGTPLPLIDSGEVHAALSRFPLIETYATETIPPGTLVVRIVERTPVGVIDTGSGLELVDAAGVVIERPAERPEGQPLIEVDGGVADEGFRAVAGVVRSLPADVRAQLTRATAETTDDVRLELAGGASVVWGSAEESALKATVLAALMRAAPPDTVSLYDVSAPSSPVTE